MVNVDVTSNEGMSSMTMVARDCKGKMVFLVTKNWEANSTNLAELNALIWILALLRDRFGKEWSGKVTFKDWYTNQRVLV